jgi:hypothetical protein
VHGRRGITKRAAEPVPHVGSVPLFFSIIAAKCVPLARKRLPR